MSTFRSLLAKSICMSMLAIPTLAVPAAAGVDDHPGQSAAETAAGRAWDSIDDVRLATARYHDVAVAIEDGFAPFALDGGTQPTCFDGPSGGMGVHYVRGVDEHVDLTSPEAMVYELTLQRASPPGRGRVRRSCGGGGERRWWRGSTT